MAVIYISVGSNIEPERQIQQAVESMQKCFDNLVCSPVYQAEAVGFEGPSFLNLVVMAQTTRSVGHVCRALREIEDDSGRDRTVPKFSSRTMDLDLLLYDRVVTDTPVQLPRGEITEHAFVLKPLVDLSPQLSHPMLNKTMHQLWQSFSQPSQVLSPYPMSLT